MDVHELPDQVPNAWLAPPSLGRGSSPSGSSQGPLSEPSELRASSWRSSKRASGLQTASKRSSWWEGRSSWLSLGSDDDLPRTLDASDTETTRRRRPSSSWIVWTPQEWQSDQLAFPGHAPATTAPEAFPPLAPPTVPPKPGQALGVPLAPAAAAAPPAQSKPKGPPPIPPGPRKYFVVLGTFCALFASFGWRSGSGLFQVYYQETLFRNESASTIAWVNSLGFFLMYGGAMVIQPITAKFGITVTMVIGSILHVSGLFLTSFATQFWQVVITQGFVSSLGAGALFFSSVATVSRWFPGRPSLPLGIGAGGSSLGGVYFPLTIQYLLPKVGFGWAMRISTLVVMLLAIVACLGIKTPPGGLQPPAPPAPPGAPPRKPPRIWYGFTNRTPAMTIFGLAFISNGYFLVLTFLITVAHFHGGWADPFNALVILNGSSFFGRVIPGLFADKLGKYNTMVLLSLVSIILVFGLWIPGTSYAASVAFSVLYGFFSGSIISIGPSLVFQICEPQVIGVVIMLLYLTQGLAALFVNPIGGALLTVDHDHPLLPLQVMAGGLISIGSLLLLVTRTEQTGWSWKGYL